VGADGSVVDLERMLTGGGTASVVDAVSSYAPRSSEMKSLRTILRLHPDFSRAKLLKSDTDGSDFSIIGSSAEVISELRPVLHFEYDTGFTPDGEAEALAAVKCLFEIGYRYFLVYDNFGNYLISLAAPDIERFVDLNTCLASNRTKKRHKGHLLFRYFAPWRKRTQTCFIPCAAWNGNWRDPDGHGQR